MGLRVEGNPELGDDLARVLEDAELDEAQEQTLEREFAREHHLITREDRLEKVAEDLVAPFLGRGWPGKAMAVCIDKATAVRMYDKVQKYWKRDVERTRAALATAPPEDLPALERRLHLLETSDMAVVVSESRNEIADLAAKGLDIVPHRKRLVTEALVPICSTIYLDKPMRNHTLMQTIACANRVKSGGGPAQETFAYATRAPSWLRSRRRSRRRARSASARASTSMRSHGHRRPASGARTRSAKEQNACVPPTKTSGGF